MCLILIKTLRNPLKFGITKCMILEQNLIPEAGCLLRFEASPCRDPGGLHRLFLTALGFRNQHNFFRNQEQDYNKALSSKDFKALRPDLGSVTRTVKSIR